MTSPPSPPPPERRPGSRIRAWVRLAGIAPVVGFHALRTGLAGALRRGDAADRVRAGTRAFHACCRQIARIAGIRIAGPALPLPPGPCLVCANHVSYLDVLVLSWCADAVFVSRGDVAGWPVVGGLARLGGTIFLDRERRRDTARVAGEIGDLLDRGFRVVVFPEGRNGTGEELLRFRSPLLEAACARSVPCVPVAIRYAVPADAGASVPRHVAWADDTPFTEHVLTALGLRRIDVRVTVGAPRVGTDRKALAAALEADVRALLSAAAGPSPGR